MAEEDDNRGLSAHEVVQPHAISARRHDVNVSQRLRRDLRVAHEHGPPVGAGPAAVAEGRHGVALAADLVGRAERLHRVAARRQREGGAGREGQRDDHSAELHLVALCGRLACERSTNVQLFGASAAVWKTDAHRHCSEMCAALLAAHALTATGRRKQRAAGS